MTILVTGGSGFVGLSLIQYLHDNNSSSCAAVVRKKNNSLPVSVEQIVVDDCDDNLISTQRLKPIDVVVHLAARVHIFKDSSDNPLRDFRLVNTQLTLNFARQSAAAGVSRFIFLSSVKVNGSKTKSGIFFSTTVDAPPKDPFGISKYEAEVGLRRISKETGMEVVIIRSPLIYGVGVKANFLSMMKLVNSGIPLPFGSIKNERSLVSIDNLTDLINVCIDHPSAANETFLVSDDDDLSTTELLKRLGRALNKPVRLFRLPQSWFLVFLSFIGKRDMAQNLYGSLRVDISKTKSLLGWTPKVSVDESLLLTARAWLSQNK